MPLPEPAVTAGWPRQGEHAARCRQREEYAARRALFLQTYRLSASGEDDDDDEGLRGRVARLLREARAAGSAAAAHAACRARWWLRAGLGRAWQGWTASARRPLRRAHGGRHYHRPSLLGCFGAKYRYLQGFA